MKKESGFTLLELIITMVVAVILISLVVPGFRALISSNQATAGVNELVSAINFARSVAVNENRIIRVCSSNSAKTASVSGGDGAWVDGWLVQDNDTNQILLVGNGLSGQLETNDSDGIGIITFESDGRLTDTQELTLTLEWQGCADNDARQLGVCRT
ncbi:MAG: GspH/FimT family pseudopilin [gamma proteobacterium symbiont of Bathyaustriella thionipta]|nr:GspH/FimT family pseudopilin [gamma proteobacterium symbiont of Bathyaustriella thionipta]